MRTTRFNLILGAWLASVSFSSAVDIMPLDAAQIAAMPEFARWGVVPGDVAMRNEVVQVVIQATPVKGQGGRVGRCLMFAPQGGEPFGVEIGPASEWTRGEGGRSAQVAVVRFVRKSTDWNAELVYQLSDGSPWLDVSTTIRNSSKSTLEIPIVDAVHAPSSAKAVKDDAHGAAVFGSADGPTFADLVVKGKTNSSGRNGDWFVGHVSGDPTSGFLPRMGKRLLRFGRSDTVSPLAVDADWDATTKDRKNWFRIAPGGERTLSRRLLLTSAGSEMRPMLDLANQKAAPTVQLVPAGSHPQPAKSAAAARTPRSLPSRTAGAPKAPEPAPSRPTITESAPPSLPTANVVAKESLPLPPAPPKPVASAPKPAPAAPKPAPPGDGLIVVPADETPKVINEVLKDLKDLPPPIK